MNNLQQLRDLGQSLWLYNITRDTGGSIECTLTDSPTQRHELV